jgi:hypothetical protein
MNIIPKGLTPMPLFPGHEPPPVKKIIIYCVIAVAILVLLGYLFPGGDLPA